jgi:hypothetical protein
VDDQVHGQQRGRETDLTGRRLKFAAVLVAVVLALTGFSSGTGKSSKSKGSSSSGSGGGCSSSKKKNHDYDSDDSDAAGSASGGSYPGDPTATATSGSDALAQIVTCVRKAKGKVKAVTYATVRVEAPTGLTETYEVDVEFRSSLGVLVDSANTKVTLDSGESTTVTVPMESPKQVKSVARCEVSARVSY